MPSAVSISKVASAALVGAVLRLMWYPQIVVGLAFFGTGLGIKLVSNWLGIALILTVTVVVGILAVVLNIQSVVMSLPPSVLRVAEEYSPRILAQLERIPLWTIVIIGFGVPAIGQLTGSYTVVRFVPYYFAGIPAKTHFLRVRCKQNTGAHGRNEQLAIVDYLQRIGGHNYPSGQFLSCLNAKLDSSQQNRISATKHLGFKKNPDSALRPRKPSNNPAVFFCFDRLGVSDIVVSARSSDY